MTSEPRGLEPTYAERTDDVDTKIEILRQALRAGNHELALGVADSIKDTVTNSRCVGGHPESVDVPTDGWRPVGDLPDLWQQWADGWELYQVVEATEPIGQPRQTEPVDLIAGLPVDRVASPGRELRVARLHEGHPREIRSQVYGEIRRGPEWFANLVFEVDVPAEGAALFLLVCGNPAAQYPDYLSGLRVHGEGVGLEIETPDYVATLSSQMGQLESLTPKWHLGGLRLSTHGNGHGEPPNLDWAHDYMSAGPFQKMRTNNWAACPNYEVVRGPICTIVRRFGFPHSPVHPLFSPSRLFMDLSYTFYAGVPYFLKDGSMEATRDFQVHVARDDEWYFGGRPFDDSLWMDASGHIHEGTVPPDQIDDVWGVGFFHRETRDSMFAIYLEHRLDLPSGTAADEDDATLHHHADITVAHTRAGNPPHASVWCRPMLRDNARLRTGMRLVQRNAYLLAPYPEEDGKAGLEDLRRRLLNPVRISLAATASFDEGAPPADVHPLARIGERSVDWPRKRIIWEAMRDVIDDQLSGQQASLVDLGYIYDVRTRGGDVHVLMTMPHRGRPKYNFLANPLRTRLGEIPGVGSVTVDLTWEPAWTPNRLTDAGRRKMGFTD